MTTAFQRSIGAGYRAAWQLALPITALPDEWRVRGYTHCGPARLRSLRSLIERTQHVPGSVVECGVAGGGSAAMMSLTMQRSGRKPLYLFDTFAGLPSPSTSDPDYHRAMEYVGDCRGTEAEVKKLFERLNLPAPVCVPGLFQDTVARTDTGTIAFLHLDGDWYESTLTCLQALWPRVANGGCIQIDDYGYWQGCRRAVEEFFGPNVPQLHVIDHTGVWLEKRG